MFTGRLLVVNRRAREKSAFGMVSLGSKSRCRFDEHFIMIIYFVGSKLSLPASMGITHSK